MSDRLYTEKDVADLLAVSVRTVRRLKNTGKMKAVQMVVGTRYEDREVQRYLRTVERHATGPHLVELPQRFTLYRFLDAEGGLLYVGITATGAQRWTHHSKYQSWWTEVATIRVEHLSSLEEVLAAEAVAIRSEDPRYNKAGR